MPEDDPPPPTSRLVLVRHGEARAGAEHFVGGPKGCKGLTGLGRRQAEQLCRRLLDHGELAEAVALVSSTLPRAVETAQLIAAGVGGGVLPLEQDDDLCEMFPGEGDGMTYDEFTERYGSFDIWEEPDRELSPGGESMRVFSARVARALPALMARHPTGTVVAVVHGGVIAEAFSALGALTLTKALEGTPANCSMTEWAEGGLGMPWKLIRYNDASHLL